MFYPKVDWRLVTPCLFLVSIGLIILKSVAPSYFLIQLIFSLLSILVFFLLSQIDYKILFSLHLPLTLLSSGLLFLPFLLNVASRGAYRWLYFGTVSLQPSELVKPFLIITFAVLFYSLSSLRRNILYLVCFIPLFLIFKQPDLGTFLVILVGILVIILSRIRLTHLFLLCFIFIVSIVPVYKYVLKDYQRQRLITFINPYQDPLDKGYHVIQSVISVGSGGFLGKGLGQGSQSQLRFLPEHHTDFIFASISEELGFVGASVVVILFLFLLNRIYRISQLVSDPAASAFCTSILGMLAFQIFINIGMNMGIAPVTGITLPFISYGGSSLLSLGITLGLVASIGQNSHWL